MTDNDGGLDHVGQVHALWRREMPDVSLDGSAIFARARRINLILSEKIDSLLARHGLDAGEYFVLAALRRAGAPYALRPTELYRGLMVSSGGLSDQLRRLEQRGLVRRKHSEEDRRSMLVELTGPGRRVIERAFREDMEVENALVARLGAAERAQLARLLHKLGALLEDEPAAKLD